MKGRAVNPPDNGLLMPCENGDPICGMGVETWTEGGTPLMGWGC